MFREALGRQALALPAPEGVFFDVSSAGGALTVNHGANVEFGQRDPPANSRFPKGAAWKMLKGATPGRCKVTGAETFPDFAIDWDKVRRHAWDFSRWRTALRLLEQKLHRRN